MRVALAVALVLMAPSFGAAAERCPWLNAATAGGALGGPVQFTVTPTSCDFVRHGAHESALRIEVVAASGPHAKCESGAEAVKAVGNEAQACSYAAGSGWLAEQVVGRVRDQAFLLRISTNDPTVDAKTLRLKVRNLSEQIAGILF